MINVITHGDAVLNLQQLAQIPVPTRENAGSRWKPIQHADLMNSIIDEVESRGWKIGKSVFSVTGNQLGIVGAFELKETGIVTPEGVDLSLGVMADNDQRRAVRLYAGGNVIICNNGLVIGEEVLARKHTAGFDLREALKGGLDHYVTESEKLCALVAQMRETPISNAQAGGLLAQAAAKDLMGSALLFEVAAEFLNPRHPEHGTGTAWGIMNAFTEVVKKTTPVKQLQRINEFRQLVLTA